MEFRIINPSIIRDSMMNNEEMIKQFIDLYLVQCPLDFDALTKSIELQDPKAINSSAHHIKPTMEYIGASDLRFAFQELEKLGANNADIEDIQAKFTEIKPHFELMLEELKAFQSLA